MRAGADHFKVDKMLRQWVIEPAQSSWWSPIVTVKIKDRKRREMTVLYRIQASERSDYKIC